MATPAAASPAREEVRQVAPKLIELSESVLYGDVWERPGLSKRDRSLITVAALTAMYRGDQLPVHDVRREAATPHREAGARWAETPRAVAEGTEVVFTSLPGPPEVEAV